MGFLSTMRTERDVLRINNKVKDIISTGRSGREADAYSAKVKNIFAGRLSKLIHLTVASESGSKLKDDL